MLQQSAGLIDIDSNGHVFMRVDTTPTVSGNRRSVRITTQYSYTGGLVLLDAVHMPTGCGTWPAFWSNGPDWPTFGEIDIVEGVNDYSNNQATIHTAHGCTIPTPGEEPVREWEIPAVRRYYRELDFFVLPPPAR